MKTEITRITWEDIVFESRNKEYGAYPIRKSYDENVAKASLIALLFAAFVFGCLQIASLMKVEIKIPPSICKLPGIINPPIVTPDPIVKKPTMAAEQKTNNNLLARIVKHDVIDTPPVMPVEATQVGSETGTTMDVTAVGVDPGLGVIATPVVVEPPKPLRSHK